MHRTQHRLTAGRRGRLSGCEQNLILPPCESLMQHWVPLHVRRISRAPVEPQRLLGTSGGAALCFIGHGAFGFITKAAWIPYFGVVGIPEAWAWTLMPIVGAVDVTAGMWVLFGPRGLPLVYMSGVGAVDGAAATAVR